MSASSTARILRPSKVLTSTPRCQLGWSLVPGTDVTISPYSVWRQARECRNGGSVIQQATRSRWTEGGTWIELSSVPCKVPPDYAHFGDFLKVPPMYPPRTLSPISHLPSRPSLTIQCSSITRAHIHGTDHSIARCEKPINQKSGSGNCAPLTMATLDRDFELDENTCDDRIDQANPRFY